MKKTIKNFFKHLFLLSALGLILVFLFSVVPMAIKIITVLTMAFWTAALSTKLTITAVISFFSWLFFIDWPQPIDDDEYNAKMDAVIKETSNHE